MHSPRPCTSRKAKPSVLCTNCSSRRSHTRRRHLYARLYIHNRCTHLPPVQAERPSQVSCAPIAQVVEVTQDVGISIYTPIYTRLYVYRSKLIYIYICINTHACMYTSTNKSTYTLHTHTHSHTHTHTHTNTPTHTPRPWKSGKAKPSFFCNNRWSCSNLTERTLSNTSVSPNPST